MVILFDEESRTFSAVEDTREFGDNNTKMNVLKRVGNHIATHRTSYATGAGAVSGTVAGALIGRNKAKKAGLTKGTKEYRRAVAKGAGIGFGVGAATGYGAERVGTNIARTHAGRKALMEEKGVKSRKDLKAQFNGDKKAMRAAITSKAGYKKRFGNW